MGTTFNAIDIVLVILVLLSVYNGYRRGFIGGMVDLLGWALALVAGLRFYEPLARYIGPRVDFWSESDDQAVAFILIVTLVVIVIQLVAHLAFARSKDIHERPSNRTLGILPGLANGLITAAIVSALLLAVPLNESIRERARESVLVNRLAVYAEQLEARLHPILAEPIARRLNLLTVQPESHERVTLPFKVETTRPRPELETRMLELVNRERVAAGLQPLTADPELTEVARKHSADMFARGYFAHETPEDRDPFDRMREAKVNFLTAGENLALAPTVQLAHSGLMNSPGHRANILRPQFGRVGIGIMDGGIRGLMVTQNFRN
jgi:uncharacterized protein YkwD